jgi:hypothetical protein
MRDPFVRGSEVPMSNVFERSTLQFSPAAGSGAIAWSVMRLSGLFSLGAMPVLLASDAWRTPTGAGLMVTMTLLASRSHVGYLRLRAR